MKHQKTPEYFKILNKKEKIAKKDRVQAIKGSVKLILHDISLLKIAAFRLDNEEKIDKITYEEEKKQLDENMSGVRHEFDNILNLKK